MSDTTTEQTSEAQGDSFEAQGAQENQERRRALPKVRRQTSFAAEDEAVLRWWDSQRDVALSLHDIIVEAIERNGYGDYHFRAVEQKPRVGRPPRQAQLAELPEEGDAAEPATSADDATVTVTVSEEPQVLQVESEPVEAAAPGRDDHSESAHEAGETDNDPGAMDSLLNGI